MKTARFKTNIKCMGCVSTVTPRLEEANEIIHWEVDLQNPDKILTVQLQSAAGIATVKQVVQDAGFRLEEVL